MPALFPQERFLPATKPVVTTHIKRVQSLYTVSLFPDFQAQAIKEIQIMPESMFPAASYAPRRKLLHIRQAAH